MQLRSSSTPPPKSTTTTGTAHSTSKRPKSEDGSSASPKRTSPAKKVKKEESVSPKLKSKAKKEEVVKDEDLKAKETKPAKEITDDVKKSSLSLPGDLPPSSFPAITEKNSSRAHGTLERGHIYFIYRPKVELEEAHGLDEISRLQILLLPSPSSLEASEDSGIKKDEDDLRPSATTSEPSSSHSPSVKARNEPDHKPHRLIVVGRKRIPLTATGKHEVLWGKVIEVGDDLKALREKLGKSEYETKTLGTRHLSPARIAARGQYILHSPPENVETAPKGSKDMSKVFKTYLAYKLVVPHQLGDVQNDLQLQEEGAFQIQIRDPHSTSNNPRVRDPKESAKAKLPKALSSLLTTKFAPLNPPSLLNFPGLELLMIASAHSVASNLGQEVAKEELFDPAEKEAVGFEEGSHESAAKGALRELGMEGELEGALEGEWV